MIIKDKIEDVATFSAPKSESTEYRLKNSAKAFYVLSTSLYKDPILAILRELGCNAQDSHVAAGNSAPWKLHLPSNLDPMLEISDQGLGMSHEEVMTLFTTFFESTKTDSNDYIGALGLGSKSPFSYTDNYTITATKNGEKNIYSAFKSDSGIPSIVRLMSEKVNLPNGVSIQIAVKTQDRTKFVNAATNAFKFFDVKPECNVKLQYPTTARDPVPLMLFGENVTTTLGLERNVRESEYGYGTIKPAVVMGGVSYPIDADHTAFTDYQYLLSQGILIRVALGEVEMTPSREDLTYNAQTINKILSVLKEKTEKIIAYFVNKVKSFPNTPKGKWELNYYINAQLNMHSASAYHWLIVKEVERLSGIDLVKTIKDHKILQVVLDPAFFAKHELEVRIYNKHRGILRKAKTDVNKITFDSSTCFDLIAFTFSDKKNLRWGDLTSKSSGILNANKNRVVVFYSKKAGAQQAIENELYFLDSALVDVYTLVKRQPRVTRTAGVPTNFGYTLTHTGKSWKFIKNTHNNSTAKYYIALNEDRELIVDSTYKADLPINGYYADDDIRKLLANHANEIVVYTHSYFSKHAKKVKLQSFFPEFVDKKINRQLEELTTNRDMVVELLRSSRDFSYVGGVGYNHPWAKFDLSKLNDPVLREYLSLSGQKRNDKISFVLPKILLKYLKFDNATVGSYASELETRYAKYAGVVNFSGLKTEDMFLSVLNNVYTLL